MTGSTKLVLMAPPPEMRGLPGARTLQGWADQLRQEFTDLDVVVTDDDASALEALTGADAAYGTLPSGWQAPSLGWLQAPMANPPAGYFTEELAAHPVVVTNMRGVYNDHIATHVMALLLAFARGLPHHLQNQRHRRYRRDRFATLHLPDCRVLFIGAGGVAHQAARYLEPWGPRVVAVDARPEATSGGAIDEVLPADDLDRQLPLADVVVMTVPHTPDTEGMVDRKRFALMKPSAVFINIGRGKTVVLDDLVDALEAGELGGAGLDVFDQEPLPAEHRIWELPNVLITPHTAMVGPNLDERRYEVIADNCRRLLAGEPLNQVVDKTLGF
jgi:phosphoglycerate dehydrogenase-like enzyme